MEYSIIIVEQGSALEIALRHASSKKLISEGRLEELHEELCGVVEEATVKFVGFFAVKTVRRGLEIGTGMIDIALWDMTGGAYQPDVWIHLVDSIGLKGLAKHAVSLFVRLAKMPTMADYGERGEDVTGLGDPKTLILNTFHASAEQGKAMPRNHYLSYRRQLAERRESRELLAIANWLSLITYRLRWDDWVKKQSEVGVAAPNVINTLLLRVCLRLEPGFEITYDDYRKWSARAKANGREWRTRASGRLKTFVKKKLWKYKDYRYLANWFKVYFLGEFINPRPMGGMAYFRVVHIPDKVQDRQAEESDWRKDIPKDKRAGDFS